MIIILLVLVATGIIWVVVRNVIQEGAEQVSLGKFTLDLELKNVQKVDDTHMSVQVKRNPGAGEFVGLNFIFDDGDNAVIVKQNVSLKELEQKTYTMEVLGINLSNLRKVSIAPVFRLESGKEVVGDVKDFVEFGSGVSVGSGDSNVGADCTVENVASDCGESETVRICYNGDVQDRTSSWSCVDESCEVSETYTVVEQCVSPTDVCSSSSLSCVECLTSSNCDSGYSCVDGVCETQSNPTNEFLANGFENSGNLALPYTGMSNGGSIAISTDSYEGVYSLKLTSSDSSYYYTSPDEGPSAPVVSLSGGGDVTYSVYAKGDSGVTAGLTVLCLGSDYKYYDHGNDGYKSTSAAATSTWTKLTVTHTCPSWTENVGVRLSINSKAGSVWYDNAELSTEEVTCTPGASTSCHTDGNVWSFDSCGNPESMVDDCGSGESCISGSCVEQTGDFTVYNSWDFENQVVDSAFTSSDVLAYWDLSRYDTTYRDLSDQGGTRIVNDEINGESTKAMRITQKANELYHGWGANIELGDEYEEVYLSYVWKFSPNWNSNAGGKLPGLTNTDFDKYRPYNIKLFKYWGYLYSYHYDFTDYGNGGDDSSPWAGDEDDYVNTVYLAPGSWYQITDRFVLNTFTNGVANSDGIHEMWINGVMVFQETGLKQTLDSSKKWDAFRLANFYGGDGVDYIPLTECYGYIDDIYVYKPNDDSTWGTRTLHDPNDLVFGPQRVINEDFYYDELISSPGTLKNSEYPGYSPSINEAYLIDAGVGKRVRFSGGWNVGSHDAVLFYDGKTTDAELIAIGNGEITSGEIVQSTGRYMYVRFSSNEAYALDGFSGTISFV